ncbi:winged helix DNA-binding domain-containing protein [Hymenobacter volaticus]|uniref:Winged helix DNA-binding domain-containing protein n=1 Tax=Hymenobacter volaticus TaxID=2932254 RepID=A0ABY4GD05_9BACT|nr:winged helix DNA-binding domain-containing protein [Hymenobacter volaticus]UOQ68626.1 winged helix DNA-binding domain-containing protein [Hymenobacter volaticus]
MPPQEQPERDTVPFAIAHQRMASQRIGAEKCVDPTAVVRCMGAMQAQDYGQAVWAVGVRTLASSRVEVDQAINDRNILLTWLMRGTIHLVSAEDALWMVQLFGPRLLAAASTRRKQLELDQAVITRTKSLFQEALRGGQPVPRSALMQALTQAGISPQGHRGYHLLWSLALEGFICFGPRQDNEQTFVLLEEWLPTPRNLSREEALAELATRYFTSHGPATLHDFAGWTGLPMAEVRQGHEAIKANLQTEKVAGSTLWWSSSSGLTALAEPPRVCLLPGFDEYLLGYKDRSAVLATEHSSQLCPGANGIFKQMVVVDGQIVGTWKSKPSKTTVEIDVHGFLPVRISHTELERAAAQYCRFLGVSLGAVTLSGKLTA